MDADPTPVYIASDIRAIEARARVAHPTVSLMERAGLATAEFVRNLMPSDGRDILVLAGPGNNGGDAFEAALHLRRWFYRVSLVSPDPVRDLPPDASSARARFLAEGGEILDAVPPHVSWSMAIDGLFGTGLARAPEAPHAEMIGFVNRLHCPVVALDVPSGLDADTGQVQGVAVLATHTLAFIALSPGLLTLEGPDCAGQITVAELGLDVAALLPPSGWIAGPEMFRHALKPRQRSFHKGDSGSIGILGGAQGMSGAVWLAARAAAMLGAGRVYAGPMHANEQMLDPFMPELMVRAPEDLLGLDLQAMVIGPGLGNSDLAETLLIAFVSGETPLVLDADALNLIAANDSLRMQCAARIPETVITPHPAEAARLLGCKTSDIQSDRLAAARRLRERLNAHVVLKGNGSIIVARDGHWFVNTSGNPGLATAGSGDVLAGLIGALLCQGYSGESASVLATHLHGCAADVLAARGDGPVGITAGEIAPAARRLWNTWLTKPD